MNPLLTADQRKKLTDAMILGASVEAAAASLNLRLGDIAAHAEQDKAFQTELDAAQAKCELLHLGKVNNAEGASAWRASQWILERRFPDRYESRPPGSIKKSQLAAILTSFAAILVEAISDEQQRAAALAKVDQAVTAICGDSPEGNDELCP